VPTFGVLCLNISCLGKYLIFLFQIPDLYTRNISFLFQIPDLYTQNISFLFQIPDLYSQNIQLFRIFTLQTHNFTLSSRSYTSNTPNSSVPIKFHISPLKTRCLHCIFITFKLQPLTNIHPDTN
jgi:hypothetical protein